MTRRTRKFLRNPARRSLALLTMVTGLLGSIVGIATSSSASAPAPSGTDPISATVGAVASAARTAAQQRSAFLASPAQVSIRHASKTQYASLSNTQANSLFGSLVPAIASNSAYTSPHLSAEQSIAGYADDHTARIKTGTSAHAVVESVLPLVVNGGSGNRVPVDLKLGDAGSAFAPAHPIVAVKIAKNLSGGVTLTASGVTLTPADRSGTPLQGAATRGAHAIQYPNALTDADAIVGPTPLGAELFWYLRSAKSPQQLYFKIGLPAGATLSQSHKRPGEIDVVNGGKTVAQIAAPAAADRDGTTVPVSLTLAGKILALSVPHSAGDYRYPILVDPTVTSTDTNLTSTTNWKFATNKPSAFNGFTNTNILNDQDNFSPPGTYASGDYGKWTYTTKGISQIYELTATTDQYNLGPSNTIIPFYGLLNASGSYLTTTAPASNATFGYALPFGTPSTTGYNSSGNHDQPVTTTICRTSGCNSDPQSNPTPFATSVNWTQVGTGAGSVINDQLSNATVYITQSTGTTISVLPDATICTDAIGNDTGSPQSGCAAGHSAPNATLGWTNNPNARIGFLAHDPGIGVYGTAIETYPTDNTSWTGRVAPSSPTPRLDASSGLAANCLGAQCTEYLAYSAKVGSLPDGVDQVSGIGGDAALSSLTKAQATVKVDTTPPNSVTLTAPPAYDGGTLSVSGTATDATSGVASWKVQIRSNPSGGPVGSWQTACTSSSPTSGSNYTCSFDTNAHKPDGSRTYPDGGPYQLQAVATDNATNTATTTGTPPSLTIDNTRPVMSFANPPQYAGGTLSLPGTGTDATSGVASWVVQIRSYPSSGPGSWQTLCTLTSPTSGSNYNCSFDTNAHNPDGSRTYPDGGPYQVRAIATDNAGNSAEVDSAIVLMIDNTPPNVVLIAPPVWSHWGIGFTGTGTNDAVSGIASYTGQIRSDPPGGPVGNWQTVCSWTYAIIGGSNYFCSVSSTTLNSDGSPKYPDGSTWQLRAIATDNAGNSATTTGTPPSTTVDNTPPTASIPQPSSATTGGTVSVSGTATDATSGVGTWEVMIRYYPNGAPGGDWQTVCSSTSPTSGSNYSCSFDTNARNPDGSRKYRDGPYEVVAAAQDNALNWYTTPERPPSLTIDNTPPTGSVNSPGSAIYGLAAITGSASDATSGVANWTLSILGPGTNNAWQQACAPQTLPQGGIGSTYGCTLDTTAFHPDGTYELRATVTDNDGNAQTTAPVTTLIDNTAPGGTLTAPGNYMHGTSAAVAGTATAGVSGVASWAVQIRSNPPGGPVGSWQRACSATSPIDNTFLPNISSGFYNSGTSVAVDGAHAYWTGGTSNIGRSNLDGSSPNSTFITLNNTDGYGLPSVVVDGSHIYWANQGSIGRANLDGSGVNESFITGGSDASGLAVDGTHIYWLNRGSSRIGRANLDGSGVDQSFGGIDTGAAPMGLAVNANYIYWTVNSNNTIGRANLDGTGANQSFITGTAGPWGVATDANYIYWTEQNNHTVKRANLDGTGVQSFITNAGNDLRGLAADQAYVYVARAHDENNGYAGQIARFPISGANYTCSFDTTTATLSGGDGPYQLRAVITNGAGATYTADPPANTTVDNTPPSVTLTTPPANAAGTLSVSGTATDATSGVASWRVEIQSNPSGGPLGSWQTACSSTSPTSGSNYSCSFDTSAHNPDGSRKYPDGPYQLRAVATDNASNVGTTDPAGMQIDQCTDTWTGGANDGGQWTNAGNWSLDAVPGPSDRACINGSSTNVYVFGDAQAASLVDQGLLTIGNGSSGTLHLTDSSATSTIGALTLVSGAYSTVGTVVVNGAFTLEGGGIQLQGSGTTKLEGGGTIDLGNGSATLAGQTLLNDQGTLNFISGSLYATSGTFENHATFVMAGSTRSAPKFNSAGSATIVNDSSGHFNSTTIGTNEVDWPFVNEGVVNADSSNLLFAGGGDGSAASGAAWTAANGGSIDFHYGVYHLGSGVQMAGQNIITAADVYANDIQGYGAGNGGDVSIGTSGSGSLQLTGTAVTSRVNNFTPIGGAFDLAGTSTLLVNGAFTLEGGGIQLQGSGTTKLEGGGTINLGNGSATLAGQRLLNDQGTLNFIAGVLNATSGTLENHATFVMVGANQSPPRFNSAGSAVIVNDPSGQFDSTTVGTNEVDWPFINQGAIDDTSSAFLFTGSGTASFGAQDPLSAIFPSGTPLAGLEELASSSITGDGLIELESTFDWKGGTMGGTGATNLMTPATGTIDPGPSGSVTLDTRTFRSYGTLTWVEGAFHGSNGAQLQIDSGSFVANPAESGPMDDLGQGAAPLISLASGASILKPTGANATNIGWANHLVGTVNPASGQTNSAGGTLNFTGAAQ